MSYRVGIVARGTSGPLVYNALRFATWAEAEAYALDLLARWSGAVAYRVEEVAS